MKISQERYDYINALTPTEQAGILTKLESDVGEGFTDAYHAMTKKIKIDNALKAFDDPTGNWIAQPGHPKMSAYAAELGDTGLQYTGAEIVSATEDAKKTEARLESLDKVRVRHSLPENSGFFYNSRAGNVSATFEELTKQIGVNTGQDISDFDSKKQYKQAIQKSLNSMKDGLPKDLYEERKDIVWNAWTSIFRQHNPVPGEPPRKAPGYDYFNFKQDDTTADSILEGMFEDPEIYQLWLEESK